MDRRDAEMDRLLRSSLAAPVPGLSPGFAERLSREVDRRSQPLDRSGRLMLAGYGVLSAGVSASIMHGQGLAWGWIALMTLGSMALAGALRFMRHAE
jgi:hypothetical protein